MLGNDGLNRGEKDNTRMQKKKHCLHIGLRSGNYPLQEVLSNFSSTVNLKKGARLPGVVGEQVIPSRRITALELDLTRGQ